ncbi:MAG: hypothetical protein AAGF12_43815, partial [Myxococcota bacterium]
MTWRRIPFPLGVLFGLGVALVGCADDEEPAPMCTTTLLWDPADGDITRWPEPDLLVSDPTTPNGVRLNYVPADYPELSTTLAGFESIFVDDLSDLDGFGTNAEVYFRFDGPAPVLGDLVEDPSLGAGLFIMELNGMALAEPQFVPLELELADDGTTLIFLPLEPLPDQAQVAAYVSTAAFGDACARASPAMAARFADDQATIDALIGAGAIEAGSDLVALTVYPVMSAIDDSIRVAASIAERDFAFDGPATCTAEALFEVCEVTITVGDYRDADKILRVGDNPEPTTMYQIPVTVWLPLTGQRPFPTIVFGHGLGSGREQGVELAELAAPEGFATVAMPAVAHGAHPDSEDPDAPLLAVVTRFFTLGDLTTKPFDGRRHRDHWRQSTYDKLQLTRALAA